MMVNKKQMTEEDIKLRFITPAILSKWNVQNISMETKISAKVKTDVRFTDGKINIKGNVVAREKPKKADYVLYLNSGTPIAIVEAKDNNHSVSYGLQQAKTIVFCATEEHAEAMRKELNNLNADMVAKNPDYVVRITGSDTYGKRKLDYFISVGSPYPVIATT